MLKNLHIHDFRQFQDQRIYFGKHLTVIAGHNATGKSTVLGIVGNAFELKGTNKLPLNQSQFRAEWSDIFKSSREHDVKCSQALSLTIDNQDLPDTSNIVPFRSYWNESETPPRFRILPKRKLLLNGEEKNSSAKITYPVLFLSLSRLYPIGESDTSHSNRSVLTQEDMAWFIEKYIAIFKENVGINDVTAMSISELRKKKHIGVVTELYDAITNSSGESNLSQILLSVLSFKKLRDQQGDSYKGGILLIDEVEATLHPAAQVNLIKFFEELCSDLNLQIILTTHSLAILDRICRKTENNKPESENSIELCYMTRSNDYLEIVRNPDLFFVESDMHTRCGMLSKDLRRLPVYSEDEEARWFLRKLLNNYMNLLDLMDIKIGSDQLLTFQSKDTTGHFKKSLIVLDGDQRDKIDTSEKPYQNILILPGNVRPEQIIYEYLLSLPKEHELVTLCSREGFSRKYYRDEIGPFSEKHASIKEERVRYKKWFDEVKVILDTLNVVEYWLTDNETIYEEFINQFKSKYNNLAWKNALRQIRD